MKYYIKKKYFILLFWIIFLIVCSLHFAIHCQLIITLYKYYKLYIFNLLNTTLSASSSLSLNKGNLSPLFGEKFRPLALLNSLVILQHNSLIFLTNRNIIQRKCMHMHIVVNLVQHSMFVEVLMSLIFE